ncbi:SDR family NAD(P)-dependent oxidoreductase [Helicobacter bilis]|uniref:SDR family NAD(P)-dependent oxidoreductase n=1 Tax=Helicobacter bilis TaxID=37372 RepID=UPI00248E2D1D|nr:SDR family NAD(P)-dependent oxidoreductase [Helicobacter bilis]
MKKVAIITGSASGIGLNIAEHFIKAEYRVVFCDLNENALNDIVKKYSNDEVLGLKCDVSKEEYIQNLIDKSFEKFGRIDVLINNAGLQYVAKLEDFPTHKFTQMLQIMLVGAFCATKYVLPIMKSQKFERIINMASIQWAYRLCR